MPYPCAACKTARVVASTAAAPAVPDILVADAGTAIVNGTYTYTGDVAGKPAYAKGAIVLFWDGQYWGIGEPEIASYYYAEDDVATPDLVTTWQADNEGSEPVPTVTVAP